MLVKNNPTIFNRFPVVLGTPVRRTNPSAGPAPKTITHRGVIQVINPANNALFGYVSGGFQQDGTSFIELNASKALIVTFGTDQTGSGTTLNLAMEVCFDLVSISIPLLTPTL